MLKNLCLMAFTFSAAACATIPAARQVQIRAAHDFAVDASQVKTTRIDDHTYLAESGDRKARYIEECPVVNGDLTRCSWVAREAVDVSAKARP